MLREKLKRITEEEDVNKHPQMLIALKEEIQHTVLVLKSEHPIERYTCIVHAFDFVENEFYLSIASFGLGRVFAGPEFVEYMLCNNCLQEKTKSDVAEGDYVIYFKEEQVKHIGLAKPNLRVVSKWGVGQLVEHELYQVPLQYGDNIKYFEPLSKNEALDLFIKYAETKGLRFEETK